jgi:myo-inositol-1-phosphate synthase
MIEPFHVDPSQEPVNVTKTLVKSNADILINYLPVGSKEGTKLYAEAALEAGCAFINCIPEFIASVPEWGKRFEKAGLPVAGDDIKSQVGATILHRAIAELFYERGVHIDSTYQLNIGGNTDFMNMTVENRLKTKRVSKTEAVTSLIPYEVPTRIGPSDYVPFLEDHKICYIRVNGHGFGNLPITLDAKLVVNDSPNSGGVVIDIIRAVKIALDRGISGPLTGISSYAFKHPPTQISDRGLDRRHIQDYAPTEQFLLLCRPDRDIRKPSLPALPSPDASTIHRIHGKKKKKITPLIKGGSHVNVYIKLLRELLVPVTDRNLGDVSSFRDLALSPPLVSE